jgi:hypothetical protein
MNRAGPLTILAFAQRLCAGYPGGRTAILIGIPFGTLTKTSVPSFGAKNGVIL